MTRHILTAMLLFGLGSVIPAAAQVDVDELYDLVDHPYADNDGVRIHYVTLGEGPVVLFIHGFPNQWYDWRHQMAALGDATSPASRRPTATSAAWTPSDVPGATKAPSGTSGIWRRIAGRTTRRC